MNNILFKWYCYNRDGSINYDRLSRLAGLTKSDLIFQAKNNFNLIDSASLMSGVFVGYHPTSKNPMFFAPWIMKTCYHSNEDLKYINGLVTKQYDVPDWATYEYFIMDSSGKMLYKNCNVSQAIDESGVIHLQTDDYSLNHFVYPAERKKYKYKNFYCYGSSFDDLNSHIKSLSGSKIITTPKHFKKGFSKTAEITLNNHSSLEKQ